MVAVANIVAGFVPPDYTGGGFYHGQGLAGGGSPITTAATRLYYHPIYLTKIRTWQGFSCRNTGTSDSGEKARMGLYTHGGPWGPGTLVKAATEITLSGAASDFSTSDSFNNPYVGWYWLAFHAQATSDFWALNAVGAQLTATGYTNANHFVSLFGSMGPGSDNAPSVAGRFADTTYGALASTAVSPIDRTSTVPWVALIA